MYSSGSDPIDLERRHMRSACLDHERDTGSRAGRLVRLLICNELHILEECAIRCIVDLFRGCGGRSPSALVYPSGNKCEK